MNGKLRVFHHILIRLSINCVRIDNVVVMVLQDKKSDVISQNGVQPLVTIGSVSGTMLAIAQRIISHSFALDLYCQIIHLGRNMTLCSVVGVLGLATDRFVTEPIVKGIKSFYEVEFELYL